MGVTVGVIVGVTDWVGVGVTQSSATYPELPPPLSWKIFLSVVKLGLVSTGAK